MKLQPSFEIQENILKVEVQGTYTIGKEKDDLIEVWKVIANFCEENQCSKILTLWNVTGKITLLEAYEIISQGAELYNWSRHYKLAIIHLDQSQYAQQLYQFAEDVSYNRGIWYKSFLREDEAKEWLLEENTLHS
ncbi:hypothetical protein [Sediminitomix flava]|uniref:SpoIIAA-like protein n=1 Tax=Sediminitomix flava TaxID=379075 RepID=A0A315Z7X9_SEDFL|nr:hypothetical protein [Sediminitomix flava]PWJ39300.1 hypothetical protein BC781_106201 [Sediminitomix flava]